MACERLSLSSIENDLDYFQEGDVDDFLEVEKTERNREANAEKYYSSTDIDSDDEAPSQRTNEPKGLQEIQDHFSTNYEP